MKKVYITTDSVADRSALLGVMYAMGAVWHRDYGTYDLTQACKQYSDYPTLIFKQGMSGLTIAGETSKVHDLNWSKDPAACLKALKAYVNKKEIVINNVGDYKATITEDGIQVGCQTIPFTKFQEIVNGVAKYKAQ